jgi:hypothetical protein
LLPESGLKVVGDKLAPYQGDKMERRSFLAAALAGATTGRSAFAQAAWPSKPLRLIVPFAPGALPKFMSLRA